MTGTIVDRLLAATAAGQVLPESDDYEEPRFSDGEAETARTRVERDPGPAAYHLLMALRRGAREQYDAIDPGVRAAVLAGALGEHRQINDFGYLQPEGGYDGPAAIALLESGNAALEPLRPVLDRTEAAPISGSEEATITKIYGTRRCDFAYRYAMKTLGREPVFDADPAVRDRAIAALRDELA